MTELTLKQKLLTRHGALKTERAPWMAHWQEISMYLMPRNGRYFVQDRNRGQRRHNAIFDNTGPVALRTLSAGLMGGLTSPARPWFRLSTSDPDLDQNYEVKEWLSGVTRLMLDIFAKSNTYRMLHTSYGELGGFGTSAAIMVEDFDTVIRHHSLTAGEYCIAQDWKGNVCTVYREFEKTVAEVVKEFGINAVSPALKSMWDRGNLDTWVTLIHAIEPREDRDERAKDAKNMPWRSVYYEKAGDGEPLRESGYKRFPALCPRWDVIGGDIYGNSPGMEALGDIKQLMQEQLRKSQAIDYMTNPPLQVPTALKNREVDRFPGGVTYYDTSGASAGIKTMFDVQLDLNHLLTDIQDVRQRVRSSFYADLFMMLQQDSQDTRKTATEVAELHEEKMLMLGPVLERLHNELLDPLISNTLEDMFAAGIVPPAPDALHGQDLNVELVSMLAQAQRAIATNGIDRFVGNIGQIAQFKPEVLDKFDADEWADIYGDVLSVDPKLIVPSDKVALIRQQRAKQQQIAQEQAQMAQGADTAQKLGSVPTQGGQSNAAQDLMGMFSGYNSPGAG